MTHALDGLNGSGRAVGGEREREVPPESSAAGWEWVGILTRMWHESARAASPGEASRVSIMQTPGGLWTAAVAIGHRSWSSQVRHTPDAALREAIELAGGTYAGGAR